MNKKLKRIVAWIAIGFAVMFTVSFFCYLLDDSLLNGAIGGIAAASGAFMLALWLVIFFDNKVQKANDELMSEEKSPQKPTEEKPKSDTVIAQGEESDGNVDKDEAESKEATLDNKGKE